MAPLVVAVVVVVWCAALARPAAMASRSSWATSPLSVCRLTSQSVSFCTFFYVWGGERIN